MRFPILISYPYATKNIGLFKRWVEHPNVDVMLDSGAFTAKNLGQEITLEAYCKFLDEWGDKVFAYLLLDKVGDPKATDTNLREMLRQGYRPLPVHVLGDDQRRMDQLFELSDYVALAGLKRPGKGHCPKEYIKVKMKWAAGRKVHWLGYVKRNAFGYRPYSIDSSSWTYAQRYGWTTIYLGGGEWRKARYHERRMLLKDVRCRREMSRLATERGLDLKDWDDRERWRQKNRDASLMMSASADAYVRFGVDIFRSFNTRLFIACSLAGDEEVRCMMNAVENNYGQHADLVYV